MNTPPTLYGINATAYWVLFFSVFHLASASVFLYLLGSYLAIWGFAVRFGLLTVANTIILSGKNSQVTLKAMPLFHLAMLIYAITIIVNYASRVFNSV